MYNHYNAALLFLNKHWHPQAFGSNNVWVSFYSTFFLSESTVPTEHILAKNIMMISLQTTDTLSHRGLKNFLRKKCRAYKRFSIFSIQWVFLFWFDCLMKHKPLQSHHRYAFTCFFTRSQFNPCGLSMFSLQQIINAEVSPRYNEIQWFD